MLTHLIRPTDCCEIVGRIRQKSSKYKEQTCMSESVQSNSAVLVHFTLKLDDGTTAESTRNNGKPARSAWAMLLFPKGWSNTCWG